MSLMNRLFDRRKRLERENELLQLKLKRAELRRKLREAEEAEE